MFSLKKLDGFQFAFGVVLFVGFIIALASMLGGCGHAPVRAEEGKPFLLEGVYADGRHVTVNNGRTVTIVFSIDCLGAESHTVRVAPMTQKTFITKNRLFDNELVACSIVGQEHPVGER